MLFTKVSGVLLATALAIIGVKELAHIIYHPHELEEPAYVIEVPEEEAGAAAEEEGPVDFGRLIAEADIAAGEAASRKCLACHTFNEGGPTITGPNLHTVMGREVAGVSGFNYTPAMADHDGAWTYEAMYDFLANPRGYIPGTAMVFVGLPNEQERINLIAYMRDINPASPPLPDPLPVAEEAPAEDAAGEEAAAEDGAESVEGEDAETEGAEAPAETDEAAAEPAEDAQP